MLKKIAIDQLSLGMHVHAVCGSWFDNPFWSNSFSIGSLIDLAKLQGGRVRQVWIDTSRGADIAAPARQRLALPEVATTGIVDELAHAARIIARSRRTLAAMFEDIRLGRPLDFSQVTPLVDDISASVLRNTGALIGLARLKQAGEHTCLHSLAVCAMMVALARQLGLDEDEVHQCGMAGLLHDVGKLAVPASVLDKPGTLTDEEFATVKRHPLAGHALLRQCGNVPPVALDVCLHHHERLDGGGYPHGLRGEQLSLHVRMAAICDIYDAITSDRPYKAAWSPAVSLRRMAEWTRSGHLDAEVFAAFVKCIGIYPLGTLVRLHSERLAVVVDNSGSLLAPVVRVFFSIREQMHVPPETLDLLQEQGVDGIAGYEEPDTWNLGDLSHFWTPEVYVIE